MTTTTHAGSTGSNFDRRINFWGRTTIGFGLLISLAAPIYLFTVDGLWPGWGVLTTAFFGVATVFAISWLIEPVMFFPMLGMSGTYQAWLVGNISNKLLPASISAQAAVGVKPGTRRGELVAVAAMSGAVIVHIISLTLFVAIGGTFILSILPEQITSAFAYILPAIMTPIFVQLAASLRDARTLIFSVLLSVLLVFLVEPAVGEAAALAMPFAIILTVTAAVLMARRSPPTSPDPTVDTATLSTPIASK